VKRFFRARKKLLIKNKDHHQDTKAPRKACRERMQLFSASSAAIHGVKRSLVVLAPWW